MRSEHERREPTVAAAEVQHPTGQAPSEIRDEHVLAFAPVRHPVGALEVAARVLGIAPPVRVHDAGRPPRSTVPGSTSDTWACTTFHPPSRRAHVWLWRPMVGPPGRKNSVATIAWSGPNAVTTVCCSV